MIRIGATDPKTKLIRGTAIATASSLAKKARSILTAGSSRAYSNKRSRENECRNGMPHVEGKVCPTKPICHRGGLCK